MNEVILTCKAVKFHFELDEAAFFEWIKKIPSIIKYNGRGNELYLYFKNKNISDDDLRSVIGLFYRYKIDMKQLQIFLDDNNREWFEGKPKGFWYHRVFGKPVKKINK